MLTTSTGCWPKEVEGWKDEVWMKAHLGGEPVGWMGVSTEILSGLNFLRHARVVGGRLWGVEIPFDSVTPRNNMVEDNRVRPNMLELPLDKAWPSPMDSGDPAPSFTKEDLPLHAGTFGRFGISIQEMRSGVGHQSR